MEPAATRAGQPLRPLTLPNLIGYARLGLLAVFLAIALPSEDGRVAVRNLRRTAKHGLEKLEKDHEVGQDDVTGAEKRLDGMTKKHTDEIDEMLKNKEAELIEV